MDASFLYLKSLLESDDGVIYFHYYSSDNPKEILYNMEKYKFKTHRLPDYAIVTYYMYDPDINIMAGEYTSSSAQRVQMLKKVSGITADVIEPVTRKMIINLEIDLSWDSKNT